MIRGQTVRVLAGPWRGHIAVMESEERALAGNMLVRVRYLNPIPVDVTHGVFDEKHLAPHS